MPVLPPESPLIGRDELLDTLLAGLRMRNSPTQLIVGPEGSGKTAIASGLAKKLHEVQTGPLAGYTISLLTAEEILQAESASGLVVEAVEKAGPLSVLFIDDLDAATLIGSELGTRTDLLVALRTAINRPDRHLILTISHPYAEKLQRVYPEFVDELQLVDLPPLSAESLQLIANRQAKKTGLVSPSGNRRRRRSHGLPGPVNSRSPVAPGAGSPQTRPSGGYCGTQWLE